MNHCAVQQNAFAASYEEMRPPALAVGADRRQHHNQPLLCPKPRRLGPLAAAAGDPVRSVRWQASHQADLCDSLAGAELLDIFLTKGGDLNQVASSPPFFCGSPPSRAANPVVQDARFGEDRPLVPVSPRPAVQSGSPISPRKPCTLAKFGLTPAAVRIEGFDCLDRDRRRSHGITAVA